MANESISSDVTLFQALAARARAASDGRLAIDVACGLIAALGLALWRPAIWPAGAGIAVGLASFGAWGIAEREARERAKDVRTSRGVVRALRLVQGLSIVVGVLAALVAGFTLLGIALGTIIS